jgi:type II secretion system protein H
VNGHRQRQRGFSLLELLVTLFVIVLVTSLVTLNVGSGDADLELQGAVEGLANTANYALDEAQFTGTDYGLLLTLEPGEEGPVYHYRWLERGLSFWAAPASGKDVFSQGQLPPGLELELILDEVIQEEASFTELAERPAPQIILYASGETSPGSLNLIATDSRDVVWRIDWDLLGNFRARRGYELEEGETL